MTRVKERLDALRSVSSPGEALRLVFRKLIYRRIRLGRYEVRAGSSRAPAVEPACEIEILGGGDFDRVLGTSPYLTPEDVSQFRRQESVCMVALDEGHIVASSWMTQGSVFVQDLHRSLSVPTNEHFSCRSYVNPDYRGRSLLGQMLYAYSQTVSPNDIIWGLVFDWNVASIRTLEKLGWRRSAEYQTTFLVGTKLTWERRLPPLPPVLR